MKCIALTFLLFTIDQMITGVSVGTMRNSLLKLDPSSNMTISRSKCNECICAMFFPSTGNASIISLNCLIIDTDQVTCQLFTESNYQISSSYEIEVNLSSIFYFRQLPSISPSTRMTSERVTTIEGNSYLMIEFFIQLSTVIIVATTMKQIRSLTNITRIGDPIVGLYNTTAGNSTGGKNGRFSNSGESPAQAIDHSTSTKYLNFGGTGDFYLTANAPGVGTGFYVTPAISNSSIAVALRFATANDEPNRDPISVILEGTNSDLLDVGSSWNLIYSGPTGISSAIAPARNQYVSQQNFSNTIPYKSYRLLITSQRAPAWAVQYSEAQIIGYV